VAWQSCFLVQNSSGSFAAVGAATDCYGPGWRASRPSSVA